nr:RNA-directed DNA polymerase, eukaryota [Tanacetum cinerariifolium]
MTTLPIALQGNKTTFSCEKCIPHRLNLSSRGIDIPSIGCPLCDANVKSSNNIFFECDNAKVSWNVVRTWCNVPFSSCASFDQWKVWSYGLQLD